MRLPTIVVRHEILNSWLAVSDCTRSRLASELRVSKGRVSQLLTSYEEPSAHLIAKLMTLTNLPFDRLFRVLREVPPPSSIVSSSLRSVRTLRALRRPRAGALVGAGRANRR